MSKYYEKTKSNYSKDINHLVSFNRITSQEMEAHRSYLKDRIAHFIKETNSNIGNEILEDFEKYQSLFWIVTPYAENLSRIIRKTREDAA